jgi:hypothetical protein
MRVSAHFGKSPMSFENIVITMPNQEVQSGTLTKKTESSPIKIVKKIPTSHD